MSHFGKRMVICLSKIPDQKSDSLGIQASTVDSKQGGFHRIHSGMLSYTINTPF